MAYDEQLAQRVRDVLAGEQGIADPSTLVEKKMFGGIAFLLQGNMCCGVRNDELLVRVGPAAYPGAIAQPHTRVFDLSGREMAGWLIVTPSGIATDEALRSWVRLGVDFARTLPAK